MARLRLCVRSNDDAPVPAFSIACDSFCGMRLAATTRLLRAANRSCAHVLRSGLPTSYQRARYVELLNVHDLVVAGASSRDVAYGYVFPNHRPLSGATWKGSSERRHVLRLISSARRLIASEYRKTLCHR